MSNRLPRGRVETERLPDPPAASGADDPVTPGSGVVEAARVPADGDAPDEAAAAVALPRMCPECSARYPADFNVCPRDARPLVDADDSGDDALIGVTLGRAFQIVKAVGEGGMARVYEARHVRLANKRFAVKVLHPMYAHQAEVVTRFQREAEAAAGIAHPNVVDVYDVDHTPDGRPYLVSELLQGEDLGSLLEERGKIDVLLAVRIARQICRALGAAHAEGVVHRDMKPDNVFLVGDDAVPIVKVLDFGISKVSDAGGASLTRTGYIMGTPWYMAPEQARGGKVDHRVDIYGVGAILYRALTAELPFGGDDPSEVLGAVLTQDAERPRSIEPSIPEALELVIQRAMAKEPEDRYQSMADLEADLAPFGAEARAMSLFPPAPAAAPTAPMKAGSAQAATIVSDGSRAARAASVERASKEAKLARPTIVLLSVFAYLWAGSCLVDAITASVRLSRGGVVVVTAGESLLVALVVFLVSVTPAVFWVLHVSRKVWPNSVRAVELAAKLRRVTLAATVAYALGALGVRMLPTGTDADSAYLAAPLWSIVLTTVSFVAAGATYLTTLGRASR